MSEMEPEAETPATTSNTAAAAIERADRMSIEVREHAVAPKTFDEQLRMAKWALESHLLPDSIRTVAQAWMVMQRGGELGFPGLTAFEFLYVVNNRVRLTPDGAKAKALASGLLSDMREEIIGEGDDMLARVTVVRRGIASPIVGEFSVEDAKTAKLWGKVSSGGKPSSWVTHPKRMLKARARGFVFGDAFRDVIGGLQCREVYDLDPGEVLGGEAEPTGRRASLPPPPTGPDPLLEEIAGDAEILSAPASAAAWPTAPAAFDPEESARLDALAQAREEPEPEEKPRRRSR